MKRVQAQDVSVVVPVLNEAAHLPSLLDALARLGPIESIVVDGGSRDESLEIGRRSATHVLQVGGGRGPQLAAGVAAARRPVLWIVHADAHLPSDPFAWMAGPLARGNAGAFRLRIVHPARRYRIIEVGTRLRNAFTGIPYGDQGLFLTRTLYDACGGFEPIPIMEDIAIGRAIRRVGKRIESIPASIGTDPRRWERDGAMRRTFKNWSLALRYQVLHADPHDLVNRYRPEPTLSE